MVTGKPPFEGASVAHILYKHAYEKLVWPAEVNPSLSDGVCRVIAKMMAKKPEERHQDPKELLHDLDVLRRGGEVVITDDVLKRRRPPSERAMRKALERVGRHVRRGRGAEASRGRGISTGALAAIGLVAATVVVVVAAAILGSGPERPAESNPAPPKIAASRADGPPGGPAQRQPRPLASPGTGAKIT